MRRSRKHQAEGQMTLNDFSGGLNLSMNEEMIADNELSQAENWEFSYPTGKLKTREGLVLVKDTGYDIDTLFYADNLGIFLFSSGTTLYKYTAGAVTSVGALTGSSVPMFTLWTDDLTHNPRVLIASGDSLQIYDGTTLADAVSPDADIVFTRAGRVVIACSGYDKLIYSGVNDATNWTISGDGDMQELEVGMLDGGDIVAVISISTDIVVFKSSGSIFRVINEFPDWAVYEITRSSSAMNRFSVAHIGNQAYFLDETGFMSLGTVQAYGNIKTSEEGYKVNATIAEEIDAGAKLWYVPSKGQIWVRIQTEEYLWVYHIATKAWTTFKMPGTVTGHASADDGTEYVSIGQVIYSVGGDTDSGADFECFMKTKKFTANYDYLIKRVNLGFIRRSETEGSISIGGLSYPFTIDQGGDVAYDDEDVAYDDTDPLVVINENRIVHRCSYRTEVVEPLVYISSGGITMKEINLSIVEV